MSLTANIALWEPMPLSAALRGSDVRPHGIVRGVLLGQTRRGIAIRMKRRAADTGRRERLETAVAAVRPAAKRVLNDVHYQEWEKQWSASPVHHLRCGVRRSGRGSSGTRPLLDKPLHI